MKRATPIFCCGPWKRQERVRLRAFTGTSAGSINSFIASLSYCSPDATTDDPRQSLFYRVWAPIGFSTLFVPEDVVSTSVLSRRGFEPAVGLLRQRFRGGLRDGCVVDLGVTATRVLPEERVVAGQLRLPRMAEEFLLRIQGRGPGRPPEVRNSPVADAHVLRSPVDGLEGDSAFEALRDLLFASSAYPLAFPPQPIHYCAESPCSPADARREEFIDGGFFNNDPVELAWRSLLAASQPPNAGPLEAGGPTERLAPSSRILLVHPFARRFPDPVAGEAESGGRAEDLIPFTLGLLWDFTTTARDLTLTNLLTRQPQLAEQLLLTRATYPPPSDLLHSFLGFFEEELRRFDFYLGMVEASRLLALQLPAVALEPGSGPGWSPFHCLRDLLFAGTTAHESCAEEDLTPLVAIAKASRDRVFDACRPSSAERWDSATRERAAEHPDCQRALSGAHPPHAGPDWERRTDETELAFVLRRLADHGFVFGDLDQTDADDEDALEELRSRLAEAGRALASAQGTLSPLLAAGVETAVDRVSYSPERNTVWGSLVELGWSGTIPETIPWGRLTAALELRGALTLVSSEPAWIGVSPLLGVELEPLFLSSSLLSARVALRGGFVFSSTDDLLGSPCEQPEERTRPCSRPVVQGVLSVALFHIVRLSLVGEVLPPTRPDEPLLWSLRPQLGAQVAVD